VSLDIGLLVVGHRVERASVERTGVERAGVEWAVSLNLFLGWAILLVGHFLRSSFSGAGCAIPNNKTAGTREIFPRPLQFVKPQ
jgi:hypothetical protein